MAQIEKRVRTSGVALTLNQRAADRGEATELPCGSHGGATFGTRVVWPCPFHLHPDTPASTWYGNKPVKVCRGAPFWHT